MPRLPQPQVLHDSLLGQAGALLVVRQPVAPPKPAPGQPGAASDYVPATPEIFVAVLHDAQAADGWRALAFNGHVDLGTGIRTALAQIVAEELEVPFARLAMILGHTEAAPNQGPTIASATIQISAVPLRRAAAQAREHLLALAAAHWGVAVDALRARDGAIVFQDAIDTRRLPYGALLIGRHDRLPLAGSDEAVKLKPAADYRLVGRGAARVDIPAKATGALTFVHDVRVPGMRHGRVIRPPYPGRDGGDFIGRTLLAVDEASVAHLPGRVQVVVRGDFVSVVADREEQATAAQRALRVRWREVPPAPDLSNLDAALRAQPAVPRPLRADGQAADALANAAVRRTRTYVWPYQMHASIGPSCAVADFSGGRLTVWSGTQNPHMLRIDLDRLLALGEDRIEVVRLEAAGCYGRNCADDVCGDAALLAMAVGAPVRVQLTREQEHQWEPKGTAQLIDVDAALDAQGQLLACDFAVRYPSNDAPLLALLLTGRVSGQPRTLEMGDRTAVPPYRYPHLNVVCHDMPPLVRASWLRGVSALPNSFAHDSMVDELAHAAGADPVEFRLRHLDDERARELLAATAARANWRPGQSGSRGQPEADGWLRGRGVAYARYIHSRFPGFGAAWAAWVVDLRVDPASGRVVVERVVIGQDTGLMVNPEGVRHQIHGNVVQAVSRALIEQVRFDAAGVASREWGAYPILGFADLPTIDVLLMPRQDEPPMGAGESASVPGAAAIANALFDATGARFCAPPFTPQTVRRTLAAAAAPQLLSNQ
ncbi:MAG: Nicotinate dehydrogenase subunit B [Paracidovorax wautersii]|uniref:Nicotinate dehydrogenase subunit B n=1 Tax=Paracidovorax wautersii TaxID=1177982 RepID=A0A7V8JPW9_9BURK|nr:MAG: Nicotinate dehydrogenase subunit B [Paracidovorax wautersii]